MEVQGKPGSRQEEQQVERLHLRLGEGGKKGEVQQQDCPPTQSHGSSGGGEKDSGKGKETEGQRGYLPSKADLTQHQPEGAV